MAGELKESDRTKIDIFPLQPESVQEFIDLFRMSSAATQRIVRESRRNQPLSDIPSYLFDKNLENWHAGYGDFSASKTTTDYYQTGLIYGADMARRLHSWGRLEQQQSLDPVALERALYYLQETYRGVDLPEGAPTWRRQREREVIYTGSDILSLGNAFVLHKLASESGMYADSNDAQALHVGLVDGVIFADAYEHFRHGEHMPVFDKPVEYAPPYNPKLHRMDFGGTENLPESARVFRFGETGSLQEIQNLLAREPRQGTIQEDTGFIFGGEAYGHSQLVQVGPSEFRRLITVEEVKLRQRHKTLVALGAIGFLASTDGLWLMQEYLTGRQTSVEDMTIESAIGTFFAFGMLAMYRKDAKNKIRKYYNAKVVRRPQA